MTREALTDTRKVYAGNVVRVVRVLWNERKCQSGSLLVSRWGRRGRIVKARRSFSIKSRATYPDLTSGPFVAPEFEDGAGFDGSGGRDVWVPAVHETLLFGSRLEGVDGNEHRSRHLVCSAAVCVRNGEARGGQRRSQSAMSGSGSERRWGQRLLIRGHAAHSEAISDSEGPDKREHS